MRDQLEKVGENWKVSAGTSLEKFIITTLHAAWGSTGDYFPGPQPISIERRHFGLLKRNPYVVCEKSDGVRHVFMAFTYEGTKMCILVNRALNIILAPLSLPKPAYQASNGEYCREFTQTVSVGGRAQEAYGTACRQPDGSWRIVQ
jgi:hypothetical protein